MEQWLRDAMAEEQGYTICPIRYETYTICNQKCEECKEYIDFKECIENKQSRASNI